MKRRLRKVVNFFAFNLLFFALYLNFVHQDKPGMEVNTVQANAAPASPVNGTVLVQNPEKYTDNKDQEANQASEKTIEATEVKMSIN